MTSLGGELIVPSFSTIRIGIMINKIIIPVIIIVAIIAAAFALNPSPEKHRTKISEAIAARSPLEGALGIGAITAFVSAYHPLGVASYTTVNGHLTSIGVLGVVFVLEPSTGE